MFGLERQLGRVGPSWFLRSLTISSASVWDRSEALLLLVLLGAGAWLGLRWIQARNSDDRPDGPR